MNNNLSVFNYENSAIRVLEIDGEPWFVGKDVAEVLGYSNGRDALAKHVDLDDKADVAIHDGSQNRNMTIINESGLYSLVLSSKLPTAKQFKHWATSEVFPSIRKHGAYATDDTIDKVINDPDFGIRLLTELKNERDARKQAEEEKRLLDEQNRKLAIISEAQQATIVEMKPKADYYDQILSCKNTMNVTQIAKDYGMGAAKFNQTLHDLKIQFKNKNQWVLYQCYADQGFTRSESFIYDNGHYHCCSVQTKWTQKGRLFLYNTLKAAGILPVCERT